MNYLCHFYIAERTNTDFAGAIAADFVRGDLTPWPEPLRTGMMLHRQVDSFVDSHPLVLDLKQQFQQQHRRMAGILLDMAFDHQLAVNFHQWHSQPLTKFNQRCYQELLTAPVLPCQLQQLAPRIAAGDWLGHYRHNDGINRSIAGIATRLSKPQRLLDARDEIWRLQSPIKANFTELMTQLVEHSQRWLATK
ncbi:ACP phosphodiesterase [Ferrimonas lipolytica]|uniref:DUF479 domain-containing protein n=1 Tax=Ferrimonas lipolytica TaxID=2724191 RepID=A0A6H1UEG3_9GAMM|nr:ACP phosphodiesterase [Ferrimonas lipolytica]QIZ77019.1 DUF479 domain-containing protein [Ferrimonas lipolytica]